MNFSGIVINKALNNNVQFAEELLGEKLAFVKDITLQDAFQMQDQDPDDTLIDIYYGTEGSIIFAPLDYCLDGYPMPKNLMSFTFEISDDVENYQFIYFEGENLVRTKMEMAGDIIEAYGYELAVESMETSTRGIILKQIPFILGEALEQLPLTTKVKRYRLK